VLHDGLGIALAIVYSYESLKSSCAWHCTARWVAFEIIMSSLSLHQCISWTFRLPTYTTFTKQLLSILSGRDLPTLTRPFQLVAFTAKASTYRSLARASIIIQRFQPSSFQHTMRCLKATFNNAFLSSNATCLNSLYISSMFLLYTAFRATPRQRIDI
jgi:hypothetical protein